MQSSEVSELMAQTLDDMKAVDIVALNVTNMTSITDYMLIASGTSDRHVRSIADRVIEKAGETGQDILGIEGQEYGEWVLVDLGDVVVHIMQARTREFYKLENLWTIGGETEQPTDAGRAG